MILVDSSVLISVLHGIEDEYHGRFIAAVKTGDVIIGDLILMEVLQGARSEAVANVLRSRLRAFPVVGLGGERIALQAAANYRKLRAIGITIRKTIDVLIATYCLEGNHSLLHRDRDFGHFEKHLALKTIP